jgi:hypothetical protein
VRPKLRSGAGEGLHSAKYPSSVKLIELGFESGARI